MRVLLDTHLLLWALAMPYKLGREARDVLEDPANDILFSAASVWEIAIKVGLGRADFSIRPEAIVGAAQEAGFIERGVSSAVAVRVADLPLHHRDPFDRLLVAQAMAEPAWLYTADSVLQPYSELVHLIAAAG